MFTGMTQLRGAASQTGSELLRRAALARQPHPTGVRTPALSLLLGELATFARPSGAVAVTPAVRPAAVMLLPGFGAHPARMRRLGAALAQAGHRVHHWGLGFNLGPTPENFAFLEARATTLARREQRPVVLVGWSLGGLFARELAKRHPAAIAKVVTLGTPFSGDRRANNAWRAYQFITGHPVDAPPVEADFGVKPPVPTIALWSPRDGVVAPRSACGWPGERDRAIALRCSHLGFVSSAEAIAQVLREVDHPEQ